MKPVKAPYTARQMLVCTHHREAESGKPSCGANGAQGLRDALKKTVKSNGWKGEVIVTQTGCLDICPAQGCVVGFHPEGDFYVVETDVSAAPALLSHLRRGLPST